MNKNKKAVLSQGGPRDASVNFDKKNLRIEFYKSIMERLHGNLVDANASGAKHKTP